MKKELLNLPYVTAIRYGYGLQITFKFYHLGKPHTVKYHWDPSQSYLGIRDIKGDHIDLFPHRGNNRFFLLVLIDKECHEGSTANFRSQIRDLLFPIYGHEPNMSGGWPNWRNYDTENWILTTLLPALNNLLTDKYKHLHSFDLSLEELETQVKF